jgi:hypothetical protein
VITVNMRLSLACCALPLVFAVGCGGPFDASVEGLVTLDGAVVPAGSISFVPTNGGPQAYAVVNESGTYEVFTGREAGLPSGDYSVAIVSRKQPKTTHSEAGGPAPPGEAITPRWYASPQTSGLTFKVEPGSNDINLELTSTPPAGWQDPAQRGRR